MNELLTSIEKEGGQFRRARLPSLYSDFLLQRESNPDGFAANCNAWINLLSKAARVGLLSTYSQGYDTLSLRAGEDLMQTLDTKEWGRPLALSAVIDEAVSRGKFIPYAEFLASSRSIYRPGWVIQPWRLLSWVLKRTGISDPTLTNEKVAAGRFVIIQNVEDAGASILRRIGDRGNSIDRIYPMQMFKVEAAKTMGIEGDLTDADLSVVLTYLARDKAAIAYNHQAIKFKGTDNEPLRLTSQDLTVASLKGLINDLHEQITLLSTRIATLLEKARQAVAHKSRTAALAALKSKRMGETLLEQRLDFLSRLEGVYSKIGQAADQVAMVRVIEGCSAVLRDLHRKTGDAEKVQDVVEQLREEMHKVDEVDSIWQAVGRENAVVDDEAVDEELKSILQTTETQELQKMVETQRQTADLEAIGETPGEELDEKVQEPSSTDEVTATMERVSLDDSRIGSNRSSQQETPQDEHALETGAAG